MYSLRFPHISGFLLSTVLFSTAAFAGGASKFDVNGSGRIHLTEAGHEFARTTAQMQVNGRLRLITKREAYEWMDRFIKLSNKKAQQSPDFTPVNNLKNHLALCDELLAELLLPKNQSQLALAENEKIPEKRKKQLVAELEKLRAKLKEDVSELVTDPSRENMKIIISFYDKALKETLDIN